MNVFSSMGEGSAKSSATLVEAVRNSLFIGIVSASIATVLGSTLALSMSRSKFPGKKFVDGILLLPMVIPEITQGISLAIFFQEDYLRLLTKHHSVKIGYPVFGRLLLGM